jgi:glutamine amidotransferase-like uncharacterized protein
MKKFSLLLLTFFLSLAPNQTAQAEEANPPLAIIYHGVGACGPCAIAAAKAARAAGLATTYVTEKESIPDLETLLSTAKVWIQPGGFSGKAIQHMKEPYLAAIRNFVYQGGGYVGFCAGAFLSTEMNGTTTLHGLGIVPGKTAPIFADHSPQDHAYLLNITFADELHRHIYFNGGPYFDLSGVSDPNLKVTATYDDFDGKVAGVYTLYGKGKISVLGAHPEELGIMKLIHFKLDPDGNDRFIAVRMIQSVL